VAVTSKQKEAVSDCLGRPQIVGNESKELQNTESSNIKVCIRVRPLLPFEIQRGDKPNSFLMSDCSMEIRRPEGTKHFSFDCVHTPTVNQPEIFDRSDVASLLDSVLGGMSATILAYGQTGSGKTFTCDYQASRQRGQGEESIPS
jgi:kinesin family protein C2/C3